ncbi:hypothetical protein SAMN04515668_3560 [Hymenobacter arizonensis]|uniref:Uncharacterized protein n=1 Tax=Hymenobacter arizonensis TaxID=1227077 RepID=A0A1I6ACQ2_HYMAR|nr:hypothetical protein SAMN04515668_3560 [Hymenobacter arizonensis]
MIGFISSLNMLIISIVFPVIARSYCQSSFVVARVYGLKIYKNLLIIYITKSPSQY